YIDAVAPDYVASNVLPMIRELQRGADLVGATAERLVARLAEQHEHKASDRIGAVAAIFKHFVPRRVARLRLIEFERANEAIEEFDRQCVTANRRCQRDEHGMPGFARITREQFAPPPTQEFERPGATALVRADLVAQVVGPATKRVHRTEVVAKIARHQ